MSSHAFGGIWTITKLQAVEDYLRAYLLALKRQPFELMYIDAFAGSGKCAVQRGGDRINVDGSAMRALGLTPGFDWYVLIEKSSRRCQRLRELAEAKADRTSVLQGDANERLLELVRRTNWGSFRAVAFLDPYGMHMRWTTLQQLAATRAIDVWYLFPLGGTFRQAAIDASKVSRAKAASLTEILGTDEWRTAWYTRPRTEDLFSPRPDERTFDHRQITDWVTRRLRGVFPAVLEPLVLRQQTGVPLFALYFAVANDEPKAIRAASGIAGHILNAAKHQPPMLNSQTERA